ncbi:hypothetical protein BC937DRAFT_95450 [Endogone sp. FLAS-F59071]|nr:hypothetical protein BC937DRAFT_95450 [Endogone sp. FLAS-F59071]|eukprot:RUS22886.1 hypothetical protein BC937DRAFT_95450 [Endogone sp. FLAS-F59071]
MAEKLDIADVLIVGAGPVGLFAALVFSQMGYRIRIIPPDLDKLDRHVERSGGCRIIPRSMEIIAKHCPDVAEEIEQIAYKTTDFATYYDGKKVNTVSQTDSICRYKHSYNLPSKRAVELVFEKKLQNLGVNIERSTVVSDLEVEEVEGSGMYKINPVIVTMQKQPATPTTEIVRARYLIAADGSRSFCRRKLGISFDGPQEVLHMADLGLVGRSTHPDAHNSW